MSGSTWTWLGTSTAWAEAANWQLAGGSAGNGNDYPASGDTAIVDSGTVAPLTLTGSQLSDNTINLSNGGVLDFANGATLDSVSNVFAIGPSDTIGVSGLFNDLGNIDVTGSNATLSIQLNGGTLAANNSVDLGLNVEQGDTLLVNSGVLQDQEIHVHQGTAILDNVTFANDTTIDLFSVTGGYLEFQQQTTVSPDLSFVSTGSSGPSTIKLDDPSLYGLDGNDNIQGFDTGDTLDLGVNIIGTIAYSANVGYGLLTVEDTSGDTILSAVLSGGGLSGFTTGTFDVNATGSTAGDGFVVTQGESGDTVITVGTVAPPSPTTWTWTGATGTYDVSSNWTATSGPGNVNGYPADGDTALIPNGTVEVNGGAVELAGLSLGGTPGGSVVLNDATDLEVNGGLLMLGNSLLALLGGSAVDIGNSGIFVGSTVEIENGFSLVGSGTVVGGVDNHGLLASSNAPSLSASSGGTLEIFAGITGTGSITLAGGSTLIVGGTVDAGQSITFATGGPETLVLGTPGTGFSNSISGFADGDTIELGSGTTITSASVLNSSTIAVDVIVGGTAEVYDLTNVSFASGGTLAFSVGSDGVTGDEYFTLTSPTPPSPPQIAGTVAGQTDIDVLAATPFSNVAITDPNSGQTETVTVTESAAANGSFTNLGGGSYDASTGVYTVSGSTSAVTAAVDGLVFVPTFGQAGAGQSVTTSFTIAVTDTDAQSASDSTTSIAVSRASAQQTAIYYDYEAILNRMPDVAGFDYWQQQVQDGLSLSAVASGLAASGEAQADVNALYEQVLGRPGDSGGVAFWQQELANGMSQAGVVAALGASTEAQNDISVLYEQVLNRPAGSDGLAFWQQSLESGVSLAAVHTDLADSAEAQADINAYYQAILGRPADSGGLAAWQQMLATGGSMAAVEADLAGSTESQNDINALYTRILGRTVDSGGLAFWEQTEAAGGSQTTVATGLAYSGEATSDLTGAYQSAYSTTPDQGVLLTLEGRLAAGASLSSVESSLAGPLIVDTAAGQAITDYSTVQPFAAAVVSDPNGSASQTATITLTNSSGTATDANGLLSGSGLTETSAGTYTLAAASASALTADLNALVFTPTQGQVTAGQSVTTGMSVAVNDGSLTGSDTATSIIAQAVSSGSTMNFIYGSVGSDTIAATAGPDVIAENLHPLGNDVITGFNTTQDMVQLSSAMFPNFAAVESAMTTVSGSAVLHFDSSDSLTLQGVAASSLTSGNFRFV